MAKLEDAGQEALVKLCVKNFLSKWLKLGLHTQTVPIILHFACTKFFMAVKMTFKVEIPLVQGFVLPTHFQVKGTNGTRRTRGQRRQRRRGERRRRRK